MATKEDLHHLIDQLPDASLEPAARWLARAKDPMIAILDSAPVDDEPLTGEDAATIREARTRIDRGDGVALADLIADDPS